MKPPSTSGSGLTVKSAKRPVDFFVTDFGRMMVCSLSTLTRGCDLRCLVTISKSLYFKGSSPLRATAEMIKTGHPKCSSKSRSEEHTSELQSRGHLVCRLLLAK